MKNTIIILLIGALKFSLIAQEPYYNDVDLSLTGQALYTALQNKINQASISFTYGDARFAIEITDRDPNISSNVLLVYGYNDNDNNCTTDRTRDKDNFGGNNCEWNREHVFARANANPTMGNVDNSTTGIGADPHNLRSSDQQMNNNKGNRKFASGTGNAGVVSGGDWYPGDEWKGDVARMIMYMYTRYGDRCLPSLTATGATQGNTNMLQLLLQWNVEDPVNNFEDQRNPHLQSVYGNRNPFIDNPYLATIIWGGPPAEDRWNIFSVKDINFKFFEVYPNPCDSYINVTLNDISENGRLTLKTISGVTVLSKTNLQTNLSIEMSQYPPGVYFLSLNDKYNSYTKKIIIQ